MSDSAVPFDYPRIVTKRLYGSEEFIHMEPIGNLTVEDYWAWAHSALSSNVERGIVAEFLVAAALDVARGNNVRDPWADSDVIVPDGITPEGMIHIEVKSGSYIQDWDQKDFSRIVFSRLRGHAVAIDGSGILAELNESPGGKTYKSHVFVLCLQKHRDQDSFNILDIDQWDFFVLSRAEVIELSRTGDSLSLKRITHQDNFAPTPYEQLASQIRLKYKEWRAVAP